MWSWGAVVEFTKDKYSVLDQGAGAISGHTNVDTVRTEKILGTDLTKMEDTVSSVLDQQLSSPYSFLSQCIRVRRVCVEIQPIREVMPS